MEQLCLLVLVAVVVGCSASSSSTTKPASASSSTTTAVTSSRSSEAVVSLESDLAAAQVPNFINPVECRELVNLLYKHNRTHDEICRAVLETDGCQSSDAYINYVNFLYCLLPGLQWYWLTLGGVLYTLWIAVMFVVVGVIADEFFCAALEVLSEMLHMSESIAGVTLLAFGTGAPEVFSSIAAVNSAETAQPTLALGSLMGSGLLATTIIAGSLFSATPFTLAKRPFMRDILFYMGTIIWIIVILWKGSISQLEGIGFLILYLSYANIVIFGRVIWLKCWVKRRSRCRPVDGVKGNDGGNDINCDPVVDDAELRERDADERRVVSEIMSPPSRPSLLRRAESIRVKNCEKFKVNLELAEIGPHHHQYHHSGSMQDACKASAEHWDKSSSRRPSLSYGDLSSWRRQDDKKTTVPFSPAAGGTGEKSNHLKPPSPLPDIVMQSTAGEKCCSPLPTPDDRSTCRRRSSRPEHISKTTESAATTTSAGEKEEKIKRNQTLPAICVTSTDVAGRDNMAYTATDAEDSSSSRRWSHYYGSTFEEKTAARPAAALQEEEPWYIDVVHHIWPVTTQQWRRAPWYSRAFMLLKVPVQVVLFCIIPLVDNNEPSGMRNWCKWLHVWHLVFSPAFCVFLFTSWNDTTFFGIFPLYVAVLTVSSVLALLLAIFTKRHEPPRRKFHSLFALLGFLVAVSVIYKVANEIVGVLTALGVVFRLSPAMLGLTLLAWGNAVPELISSYALARRSYQRVAISSCYAGPMFAALVGTGLAYTIGAGRMKDKTIVFSAGPVSMLLAFYLLGVLVLSLVAIPLQRFSPKRWFGFLLVGLYALFLPIIVLTELKVF